MKTPHEQYLLQEWQYTTCTTDETRTKRVAGVDLLPCREPDQTAIYLRYEDSTLYPVLNISRANWEQVLAVAGAFAEGGEVRDLSALTTVCEQADQFTPGALLHGPAGFYIQHNGQPLQGPYTADELRGGRFAEWAASFAADALTNPALLMPEHPKRAFSALRSQGYKLLYFHERASAHFGYLVGWQKNPVYAIRYKGRLVTDSTFRGAVAQLAARLGKPPDTATNPALADLD